MVWNHSGRPMKPTGCSPNAAMNWLTMPTFGDRNWMIIPHITTVEMK